MEVRKNGTTLKLSPQALRLLPYWQTGQDQVVTRDEIRQELWQTNPSQENGIALPWLVAEWELRRGRNGEEPIEGADSSADKLEGRALWLSRLPGLCDEWNRQYQRTMSDHKTMRRSTKEYRS